MNEQNTRVCFFWVDINVLDVKTFRIDGTIIVEIKL